MDTQENAQGQLFHEVASVIEDSNTLYEAISDVIEANVEYMELQRQWNWIKVIAKTDNGLSQYPLGLYDSISKIYHDNAWAPAKAEVIANLAQQLNDSYVGNINHNDDQGVKRINNE